MISRRGLIGGLASLLAAPAIVKASSLMPVRALPQDPFPPMWVEYKHGGLGLIRVSYRIVAATEQDVMAVAQAA